jgi:SOS-response transcriptional repressor LexA
MTERQQIVFDFIRAYTKIHGIGPSYAVLASGLKMKSRANMHRIVMRLEKDGHLETKDRKYYSIKLVDRSINEIVNL